MSKLKDVMRNITEFDKASKFLDVNVVSEFYSRSITPTNVVRSWPGKHKKVYFWVLLENGYAVGWNETPSGWSFPVMKLKK